MRNSKIRKALDSCIHECQIYSWLNWIDRICASERVKKIYNNMGQIKLDELFKEMNDVS